MQTFDPNILRFNQISIIALIALGFLTQFAPLVAFVGLVMLLGTLEPRLALFKRLYTSFVRPTFNIATQLEQDDPRPHNFAQGLGAIFLLTSSLAFLLGANLIGWIIAALVVALALLNLTTGICVGCFLYFQYKMLPQRFAKP